MYDWKKDRLDSAVKGKNPTVVAKMKSGYVVLHDFQFFSGYCIFIAYPKAYSLNDLNIEQRSDFLIDMSLIGDAITAVCNPVRINYDILGNTDKFLHAHIYPRYSWEEEEKIKQPIFQYPKEVRTDEIYSFSEDKYASLKKSLSEKLDELMKKNY